MQNKSILRRVVRLARRRLSDRAAERAWRSAGCPAPPPPHIKRAILRNLGRRYRVPIFVESGTLFGDTLAAMRRQFHQLHSIELDPTLHRRATERFASDSKVKLWFGDSAEVLPRVLALIHAPTLFWLDGHYSGQGTARGLVDTPIREELGHIGRHPLREAHVIAIDDARVFIGKDGYPPIDELRELAAQIGFHYMEIDNDIILLAATSTTR